MFVGVCWQPAGSPPSVQTGLVRICSFVKHLVFLLLPDWTIIINHLILIGFIDSVFPGRQTADPSCGDVGTDVNLIGSSSHLIQFSSVSWETYFLFASQPFPVFLITRIVQHFRVLTPAQPRLHPETPSCDSPVRNSVSAEEKQLN